MTIAIEAINAQNFRAVIDLQLAEHQRRFVATNVFSIAQSKVHDELSPVAICEDKTPVGFALYGHDDETGRLYINRFMIDARQQGRGLGRAGLTELIRRIRSENPGRDIHLTVVPDNHVAAALYRSSGFAETGEIDEGEVVFCLPATTALETAS